MMTGITSERAYSYVITICNHNALKWKENNAHRNTVTHNHTDFYRSIKRFFEQCHYEKPK